MHEECSPHFLAATVSPTDLHLREGFSLRQVSVCVGGGLPPARGNPPAQGPKVQLQKEPQFPFENLEGSSRFNALSAAASTAASLSHTDPHPAAG